jgi:hypothetical protein
MSEKMPNDHTDPMWKMHMETLTKRMKRIEIAQKIDMALFEWYSERGMDVPNWKIKKNLDWWDDYLDSLDNPE